MSVHREMSDIPTARAHCPGKWPGLTAWKRTLTLHESLNNAKTRLPTRAAELHDDGLRGKRSRKGLRTVMTNLKDLDLTAGKWSAFNAVE